MIRFGIVDSDHVFQARVQEAARLAGDIDVVAVADTTDAGETMIRNGTLEVVLVELSPPAIDGLAMLRRLSASPPKDGPKIIATAPVSGEDDLAEAIALGADYAVLKPCRLDTLLSRVRQLGDADSPLLAAGKRSQRDAVFQDVATRLHHIGVPPHFKGHRYLIDAIGFVVHDMSLLHNVTTELYPSVARRHGTTAPRVERAIRNAVEVTLTRGNLPEIERVFGHVIDPAKGKLSNSSFIAQVADHVRVQLRVS